ncbi:MAG: BolA/IbaG family iron-sulfur metabolism protein [Gammaproteobacteria bacterium]|nr:BolA/IbaG family iron-sulfur metabolism protein [Gammaproteobacteria bacterium]
MTTIQIKTQLEAVIPESTIMVQGDDGVHFDAIVVAHQFDGLSKVKRQQMVYQALNAFILDGSLHAIALKTYTPAEWATKGSAEL